MVDYIHEKLFRKRNIDHQFTVSAEDGSFTARNSEIKFEDFELSESLCSGSELRFGSCEVGSVKFQVLNPFITLNGKWMEVSETLAGNESDPFIYGRYRVFSDRPTADKDYRDIVAYDAMYGILESDVTGWYNNILPDKESKVTLLEFRTGFISHFGLEQEATELVNDSMVVRRTIDPEQLSGRTVITAICEINGCFGHITREGKFRYVTLPKNIQGIYPRNDLYPSDWLYPTDPKASPIADGEYIKCQYDDYVTMGISKVQVRQEDNDIGAVYPDTEISEADNCYIIQGNFLVYGMNHAELSEVARNVLNVISNIIYRPANVEAVGNPCFEVGDPIRLMTKYELIETYILERKLRGIQHPRDTYISRGAEKYTENVNGVQTSFMQLMGKTNKLIRTVDETRLEMEDIEAGLSAEIKVTAGQFSVALNDTKNELTNQINMTASGLRLEITDVNNQLSNRIDITASGLRGEITDTKNQLSNEIQVTASGIRTELTDTKNGLQTQISATADGLSAEITRASAEEGKLSNSIKVTADGIRNEIKNETEGLQTQIAATAGGLDAEVRRATAEEGILSSRISMKPNSISMTVSNQSTSAGITISMKDENGKTVGGAASATIQMTGLVKFTDLQGSGTTTINGANIKTGTISADRIDADRLKVKAVNITGKLEASQINADKLQVNAANITGVLSADHIDASSIKVNAANVTGVLTIGQLPSKDITTITENTIKTANVVAEKLIVNAANIAGKITADSISINDLYSLNAKIGGFTIGLKSIYNGTNSITSNAAGIYLGTDGIRNYGGVNSCTTITGGKLTTNNAEIKGQITATSGYIGNGASGFTITNTSIYNGKNSLTAAGNGVYVGTNGIAVGGIVLSASGDAGISGRITATGGSIGGFSIANTSIYSGKTSLAGTANGVYIGTDGISIGGSKTYYNGVYNGNVQTITKPAFQITSAGNVYIGGDNLTIGGNVGIWSGNIAISNTMLITPTSIRVGAISSSITITSSGIECNSFSVGRAGSTLLNVAASNGQISVGKSGGMVGFFGSTGSTKKSISIVSSISNYSSAIGTTLNNLITALKSYGLIA